MTEVGGEGEEKEERGGRLIRQEALARHGQDSLDRQTDRQTDAQTGRPSEPDYTDGSCCLPSSILLWLGRLSHLSGRREGGWIP